MQTYKQTFYLQIRPLVRGYITHTALNFDSYYTEIKSLTRGLGYGDLGIWVL